MKPCSRTSFASRETHASIFIIPVQRARSPKSSSHSFTRNILKLNPSTRQIRQQKTPTSNLKPTNYLPGPPLHPSTAQPPKHPSPPSPQSPNINTTCPHPPTPISLSTPSLCTQPTHTSYQYTLLTTSSTPPPPPTHTSLHKNPPSKDREKEPASLPSSPNARISSPAIFQSAKAHISTCLRDSDEGVYLLR